MTVLLRPSPVRVGMKWMPFCRICTPSSNSLLTSCGKVTEHNHPSVASAQGIYKLLKRHHLPPARRRGHNDQRLDTSLVPGLNPLTDFSGTTVERHLLQPPIRHEVRDFSAFIIGNSLSDGMHFLLKTCFDPVILVIW